MRLSTNWWKSPGRTFTDDAGGFLPGVPLGCLRIGDRDQILGPRLFLGNIWSKDRGCVRRGRKPQARIQRMTMSARSWAASRSSNLWRGVATVDRDFKLLVHRAYVPTNSASPILCFSALLQRSATFMLGESVSTSNAASLKR